MCEEKPYLFEDKVVQVRKYNINFGDHRICNCGHSYYDHFIQPEMVPMGCELCDCFVFMEKEEHVETVKASELSKLRMAGGNEKKYMAVIDNGIIKDWVGIGWVDSRKAEPEDYENIPVVVRS